MFAAINRVHKHNGKAKQSLPNFVCVHQMSTSHGKFGWTSQVILYLFGVIFSCYGAERDASHFNSPMMPETSVQVENQLG